MQRKALPPQRIVSLWFPELATDRLQRLERGVSWRSHTDDRAPRVTIARQRGADRIASVNACARRLGVSIGEGLADARARIPVLVSDPADAHAENALLAALADWCDRYTPLVALDGVDGLLLDITGCAHLFAGPGSGSSTDGMLSGCLIGEAELMRDGILRLGRQGFAVRAAVADTPLAAWAMARYGLTGTALLDGVAPGDGWRTLVDLSPAALRLEAAQVAGLARVGLTRIADLIDRPRAPLAARFGQNLVHQLDRLRGVVAAPISPRLAVPALSRERRFFEPIAREEDVRGVIAALAVHLAGDLERRGEGGRAFELALFRVDGVVNRVTVGTGRPIRQPHHVLRLFAEKLAVVGDELDAGFGFDLLRLSVLEAQRIDAVQGDIDRTGDKGEALADLIDRLGARLGITRVARFLPCDSHMPEVRQKLVPAALVDEAALIWQAESPIATDTPQVRPLRLIDPPEPVEAVAMVPEGPPLRFRWRRALYEITACEGPERIAPPWWQAADPLPARDYYRVEDEAGRRFWLYREGGYEDLALAGRQPRWFLQGLYA